LWFSRFLHGKAVFILWRKEEHGEGGNTAAVLLNLPCNAARALLSLYSSPPEGMAA